MTGKIYYYRKTYSLVDHISEIDPPTIVAPVDPNAPCKKRATMTVSIFFDLVKGEEVSRLTVNTRRSSTVQYNHETHEQKSKSRTDV